MHTSGCTPPFVFPYTYCKQIIFIVIKVTGFLFNIKLYIMHMSCLSLLSVVHNKYIYIRWIIKLVIFLLVIRSLAVFLIVVDNR